MILRGGIMKYQYFNGVKFTKDRNTGYYLNSTLRKRMHRYVWEFYNKEIPNGYEIHHIDRDKSNNDISNLELMKSESHKALHSKERGVKNVKSGHLDSIRPMTKEWHQSEKGRDWHRKHYQRTKDKIHEKKEFECENCHTIFIAEITGNNRFCSNKCKSSWRRKSGVDDEARRCIICGKEFTVNKYEKTRTCSRKCGAILRSKKN